MHLHMKVFAYESMQMYNYPKPTNKFDQGCKTHISWRAHVEHPRTPTVVHFLLMYRVFVLNKKAK